MSAPTSGRSRAPVAVAVTVALAVVVLWLLVAIGSGGEVPLDPRSHERSGTSAMVALARDLGSDVTIGDRLPDLDAASGPDVIVLLTDVLDDDQRQALEDWVDGGGRLVVTDPGSPFTPVWNRSFDSVDDLGPPRTITNRCEIDALTGIDVAGIDPRGGGVLYEPFGNADTCVDDALGAYIVDSRQGRGDVIALGGSGMVVNDAIAEGENAPVVAALVAPERGTHVVVLEPGPLAGTGGGQRTLADLVAPGIPRALAQLAIAFGIYALWRARRLGRPVAEPQPVAVAGSELVAAMGNLLDRTGSTAHAGELLRADLRRFLADHLGLPADSSPAVVAAVAAERTGIDRDRLEQALGPHPITDDAALVTLAGTIDRIRQEVLAHV